MVEGDRAQWVAGRLGAAKWLAGLEALVGPTELGAPAGPATLVARAAARPLVEQLLKL